MHSGAAAAALLRRWLPARSIVGPLDVAGTAVQALAHLRSWAGKTRRQAHGAAATTARTVERQIARLALSDVPSNPCICG